LDEYGGRPCVWGRHYEGWFGVVRIHLNPDCTGGYGDYPIERFYIYVEKTAASALLVTLFFGIRYPWGGYGAPYPLWYLDAYNYGVWDSVILAEKLHQ